MPVQTMARAGCLMSTSADQLLDTRVLRSFMTLTVRNYVTGLERVIAFKVSDVSSMDTYSKDDKFYLSLYMAWGRTISVCSHTDNFQEIWVTVATHREKDQTQRTTTYTYS